MTRRRCRTRRRGLDASDLLPTATTIAFLGFTSAMIFSGSGLIAGHDDDDDTRSRLAFIAHQCSSPAVNARQMHFWALFPTTFGTRFAGDLYTIVLVYVRDPGGKQRRHQASFSTSLLNSVPTVFGGWLLGETGCRALGHLVAEVSDRSARYAESSLIFGRPFCPLARSFAPLPRHLKQLQFPSVYGRAS